MRAFALLLLILLLPFSLGEESLPSITDLELSVPHHAIIGNPITVKYSYTVECNRSESFYLFEVIDTYGTRDSLERLVHCGDHVEGERTLSSYGREITLIIHYPLVGPIASTTAEVNLHTVDCYVTYTKDLDLKVGCKRSTYPFELPVKASWKVLEYNYIEHKFVLVEEGTEELQLSPGEETVINLDHGFFDKPHPRGVRIVAEIDVNDTFTYNNSFVYHYVDPPFNHRIVSLSVPSSIEAGSPAWVNVGIHTEGIEVSSYLTHQVELIVKKGEEAVLTKTKTFQPKLNNYTSVTFEDIIIPEEGTYTLLVKVTPGGWDNTDDTVRRTVVVEGTVEVPDENETPGETPGTLPSSLDLSVEFNASNVATVGETYVAYGSVKCSTNENADLRELFAGYRFVVSYEGKIVREENGVLVLFCPSSTPVRVEFVPNEPGVYKLMYEVLSVVDTNPSNNVYEWTVIAVESNEPEVNIPEDTPAEIEMNVSSYEGMLPATVDVNVYAEDLDGISTITIDCGNGTVLSYEYGGAQSVFVASECTYTERGTYTLTVSLVDVGGNVYTKRAELTVRVPYVLIDPQDVSSITEVNVPYEANFALTLMDCTYGQYVGILFRVDDGNEILYSAEENLYFECNEQIYFAVSYTFTQPGIYHLSLITTPQNGESTSFAWEVTVQETSPPEANEPETNEPVDDTPPEIVYFRAYPEEVNVNEPVTVEWNIIDESEVNIVVDCGNGEVYTGLPTTGRLECTYASEGIFTIALTAVDAFGNEANRSTTITVVSPTSPEGGSGEEETPPEPQAPTYSVGTPDEGGEVVEPRLPPYYYTTPASPLTHTPPRYVAVQMEEPLEIPSPLTTKGAVTMERPSPATGFSVLELTPTNLVWGVVAFIVALLVFLRIL